MKILIADDDGMNLPAYEVLFEHSGHQVFTAQNGESALELLMKNNSIEILLTDLNMPGIDGLETIVEAKKISPGIRAFLGSAKITENIKQHAKNLGAEGTFDKPYDVKHICEILKK